MRPISGLDAKRLVSVEAGEGGLPYCTNTFLRGVSDDEMLQLYYCRWHPGLVHAIDDLNGELSLQYGKSQTNLDLVDAPDMRPLEYPETQFIENWVIAKHDPQLDEICACLFSDAVQNPGHITAGEDCNCVVVGHLNWRTGCKGLYRFLLEEFVQ